MLRFSRRFWGKIEKLSLGHFKFDAPIWILGNVWKLLDTVYGITGSGIKW